MRAQRAVPVVEQHPENNGASRQGVKLGRQEMYAIVQTVLGEVINDRVDADGLLAVERIDGGDELDTRARYELRYRRWSISEGGIVMKTTERMFEGMVRMQLSVWLKELADEQPQCQWVPVGALITRRDLRKSVAIEGTTQDMAAVLAQAATAMLSTGVTGLQVNVTHREESDYAAFVEVVFADLSRGKLQDPTGAHPDGKPGAMEQYAVTRNLRHLPWGFQRMRQRAARVLLAYYADRPRDEAEVVLEPARKVAAPMVPGGLTDEQLRRVQALRLENTPWGKIGEEIGLPWQTLRTAFLAWTAAQAETVRDDAAAPPAAEPEGDDVVV